MRRTLMLSTFVLYTVLAMGQENNDAKKLYNEGNRKLNAGRYSEAITKYDAALTIEKHEYYFYQKALALRRLKDEKSAIAVLRAALALNSDFAPAHHALGNAHATLRQYYESISHFERALELHPKLELARKGLAGAQTGHSLALIDSARYDEALQIARKAAVNDSSLYQPHLAAARALFNLGRYDEAIGEAELSLQLSPSAQAHAYYEIGLSRKEKGDLAGAKKAFESAGNHASHDPDAAREIRVIDSLQIEKGD